MAFFSRDARNVLMNIDSSELNSTEKIIIKKNKKGGGKKKEEKEKKGKFHNLDKGEPRCYPR